MTAAGLAERYADVTAQVLRAARAAGREGEVCLVAVSKRHPAEKIAELYRLGHRDFGENYAPELAEKQAQLRDECPGIRWHFIGRVQRNKVKTICDGVAMVHGIGAWRHLEAVRNKVSKPLPSLLLQVSALGEESKNGFSPESLRGISNVSDRFSGLGVAGLMAMPSVEVSEGGAQDFFHQIRRLRDELQVLWEVDLPVLSMGMTADFSEAILAGATHVRIGTAIFGPREA